MTSRGTHLVSTTPPKSVGGFQWKFQTFFYTHWRCTPKGYANAIWDLIIINFFAFPLFQWNFYVRLQGVPISYPQLLLNLWVDFNENCRHSSTYIGDVHPKAMQMLYEIWLFSIVLVSHIEKWMLSLSLLDLWMDFNETCVNQLLNGNI